MGKSLENLGCQRESFSLPEEVHYLNCAFIGPLPIATEEAGIEGILQKQNPTKIQPSDFFTKSDQVREAFANIIGADQSNRISIIPSASYGLAVAARNLRVEKGQNIVLLHQQFPGNVYTWRRKADDCEAQIRTVVPPDGQVRGAEWNERILEAIDLNTAVVDVPNVHWTDGTVIDVSAVAARAREVGAALVIDATQSVGVMPFDVSEIQPDVLVVAGYKWLLGPYSIGAAYYGSRFDEGVPLEENWIAREKSEVFGDLVNYQPNYHPGAIRYDVGERSNPILVPMLLASLGLISEWGPRRIQRYCHELGNIFIDEAHSIGFLLEEEKWRSSHLFGLQLPKRFDPTSIKNKLEDHNIFVSRRANALRISLHVYNDENDVEALLDALRAFA